MMVKPALHSPALALALARAAHDRAATQLMRDAARHLREAEKIDRELAKITPEENRRDC